MQRFEKVRHYSHGVGHGQAHLATAQLVAAQNRKQRRKEQHETADELQSHSQPPFD